MTDRLISADALKREMWRRCGETDIEIDKGRAKWDSGLWIRYKVFEECIALAPTIEAESIVHCNECYFAEKYVMHGESRLFCNNEDALYRDVPLCGYCYCGAKMDEEDNQ